MSALRTTRLIGASVFGLLTLLTVPTLCISQETPPVSSETGYGYVSTTEGGVTLIESDTGESVSVEGTEAVLAGDELRLSGGSRAEVQLADRNRLRLADRAELVFLTLAGSPDRSDAVTALQLRRGAMQIVVAEDHIGETPPMIETSNAYVELRRPGTYLVEAQATERTLVVVRDGVARVRAGTAVTPLNGGQEAVVEGHDGARVRLAAARGALPVERWGDEITDRYARVTEVYVDESIRYAAAPLRSHGTWVHVRGTRAWRPRVAHGWRPYTHGRWRYTPTGVLWVSYEPWGWVPHHYGSWDLVPGFGWVWFPGRRFASAWVFWYWGPKYVGWVPWGYYSHHYRNRYHLSFGVYGTAGGLTIGFGNWCFTPVDYFGRRHQRRYVRYGRDLGHERERIARGIITTDTRKIKPSEWRSPDRVKEILAHDDRGKKRSLEDIGAFIDRERRQTLPESWRPPSGDRGTRDRALIDPVSRRLPEATRARTEAREQARETLKRSPRIERVKPTRLAETTPSKPSTRERARDELKRRPSIDRTRPIRTAEPAPSRTPTRIEREPANTRRSIPIGTRPTLKRPSKSQPHVEERSSRTRPIIDKRSKAPPNLIRPESVRRSKPAPTAIPKQRKAAGTRSTGATPSRAKSRPTAPSRPSRATSRSAERATPSRATPRPTSRSQPKKTKAGRARAN